MKEVKNRTGLILLFFFLFAKLFAQEGINFEFDYAQFKNDSTSNLIEFYLYMDKASLTPEENTSNIGLTVLFDIDNSVTDEKILSKGYQFNDVYDSSSSENRSLVSLIKYAVPYGKYNLKISAVDKNDTTNSVELKDSLVVSSLIEKSLNISGIELAANIISQSDRESSSFYKNSLEVIPNPNAVYDKSPVMFYYAELYFNDVPAGDDIILKRNIIDNNGRVVNYKVKEINSFQNDLVDADVVNISNLNTGHYFLYLTLFDSTTFAYDQTFKSFYIYNPEDTSGGEYMTDYKSSDFVNMSLEECNDEFLTIKYFLSDDQKDSYVRLTSLDARRQFLYRFWKVRDYDLTTPENEQRIEIMERARYAKERFGAFTKNGIESDRGRVYIIYGPPDVIDRYDNTIDTNPYEVWTYHSIEGGVEFVFGDLTGFNNYILIHSTKRGEISDEDWLDRLYEVF